ncbi:MULTISPECIES: ABC transporter permease [Streptomyces]|uniref:ABC transporter permease n=1 Tax=Streptomyces xanthochromogenes TaxID=67384 RepID=A0ABQ3AG06_9ACTN|nr:MULTISPECIES: ABC transporter permease [Streptomyces]MYV96146.1 FtsX-like permease family protein [Streptomyces sp. SID1034]GGY52247.1 ABC transporter permease [Streptomyces xanthochromogenes]
MGTFGLLIPVAVATLRKRWLGFIGSFVALTLGVALIAAAGLLVSTSAGLENNDPSAPSLKKLLTFMAGMSGFVSVFVVASTFAFAVAGRRRETALLRAVGATPRQIRSLVLGEAVVVSLVASVCGALLGLGVAPLFARWLVSRGAAPEGFTVDAGAGPLLVAAAVEIVVAVLGAYAAARRAGRVRPVEALGDAAVDGRVMTLGRWLWAIGYLAVFATVLLLFTTMPAAMQHDPQLRDPQNMPVWSLLIDVMAIMAIALFAPLLVPPLVRLLTLPVPLASGAVGLLARQNALKAVRRTVSTATPMFLVIGLTGTVVGSTLTFGDARSLQSRAALNAQYVVEPTSGPTLPAAAVGPLRALPGARTTTVRTTLLTGLDGGNSGSSGATSGTVSATAIDGDAATTWKLPTGAGSLDRLTGSTVAVSEGLARSNGWQVGDRLTASLADGAPATLTLVALVKTPLSLSEVLLPYAVVAGHLTGDPQPTAAYVSTRQGTAPEAAGAKVTPAAQWGSGDNDPRARSDWIAMIAILGPALLYALIAIVNTMMMSTGDRLRDFATLRLTGGNDRQVLSMVGVEAVLTAATATVLALLVTTGTQAATLMLINRRILDAGSPLTLGLPWPAIGAAAAAGLALALVSSLVPARLALRTRALDLAGSRQ